MPLANDDSNFRTVPKDEKSNDTPFGLSFLQQFVEVHQVMTHSNAQMKPTSYEFLFRPIMWPFNAKVILLFSHLNSSHFMTFPHL